MPRHSLKFRLRGLLARYNQKKFLQKYRLNQRSWLIMILVAVCVSGLLYLVQVNALATKGYEIKDLETQASELKQKNKKIKLQITELRSTERLAKEVERLELIEVTRVEYLKANGTSVAINR